MHGPICMLRVPGTQMTEATCSICILGPVHVVSSPLGCHHHSNGPYSSGSPVELEGFHCQTCQDFCEVQFNFFDDVHRYTPTRSCCHLTASLGSSETATTETASCSTPSKAIRNWLLKPCPSKRWPNRTMFDQ